MNHTTASTAAAADLSPLQAVIFDWAGTLVDFGSLAPTQIFVEAFASFGITITLAQARGPMGLSKWQHIHELLQDEGIRAQWHKAFGQQPGDADVDAIYARFMPMQIAKVGEFSAPIEGAPELLGWLRAQGLKVGSCSGYPREVLNQLLPQAAANGLAPDHVVAGDEMAAGGRPGPFMALANVLALGIGDVRACVKVDDTVPGIEEGRNAGMWTVGLTLSGNEVGYSPAELAAAPAEEVRERVARAEAKLRAAGAHHVIASVKELPQVLERIAQDMRAGRMPG
ncbi:phosphonoacetaldehyde hydrolase [Delftia tsuruhatensis]|uniref:phosphonoacetaldehyde hydrolase n=1 Tax=Delftia TaxID=80865 RepID=UPI00035488FC|nr:MULTISPECIES: phosphonoacetaldehyde hydrolase [Delftia]EPD34752.1 phosphonoacetaldehyde hydrolase [Delftia acidovorans CCUG 274B]KLO61679.1 phosphonoacetaldehyde hydrolase [Delftia tsuruhatensis]PZP74218.1 MAG: phosphonoacetaldehyde hydrolase [Delftia acidovorans]TDF24760.1 phosphonoacetaldehyde hydrolase [Delftia tsuruhatensis]